MYQVEAEHMNTPQLMLMQAILINLHTHTHFPYHCNYFPALLCVSERVSACIPASGGTDSDVFVVTGVNTRGAMIDFDLSHNTGFMRRGRFDWKLNEVKYKTATNRGFNSVNTIYYKLNI